MSLDYLLLWLSAKGQGSWSQFRGAVEELCTGPDSCSVHADDDEEISARSTSDLPVYQHCRFSLQRLGHVEFFSEQIEQDWRVVPPTLALLPGDTGKGLLCGARSPDLLDGLRQADNIEVVRAVFPGMPQRIVVRGSSETVANSAVQLGLHVQADAPIAILSAAPGVRDPAMWLRSTIPGTPGWTIHRFSSSRLSWAESTLEETKSARTGLFRFTMSYQRFHFLKWNDDVYSVPVQVGKYAVLRRRRSFLVYDTVSQTLSVPAVCRPPLLIERALILCSGLLPSFDPRSRYVEYCSVPPEAARLAAQLLHQDFTR